MTTAVYYPSINLPDGPWSARLLLYWRHLQCIIPAEVLNDRQTVRPFTKNLLDSGLVQKVSDDNLMIASLAAQSACGNLVRQKRRARTTVAPQRYLIHSRKFTQEFQVLLKAEGAGTPIGEWWEVDIAFARPYMQCLAAAVASAPDVAGTLVSHNLRPPTRQANFNGKIRRDTTLARKNLIRDRLLSNSLLVPAATPSVERLLQVKYEHGEELEHFRDFIESNALRISSIEDWDFMLEALAQTEREIGRRREAVREAMSSKFGELSLTSLIPLFGGLLSFAISPTALGALPLAYGIPSALYAGIREARKFYGPNSHEPLAYSVRVERLG